MKIIRARPAETPGQIDLEVTVSGAETNDPGYVSLPAVAALGNVMDEKSSQRVKTQGAELWKVVFLGPIMVDVRKRVDFFDAFESGEFSLESL